MSDRHQDEMVIGVSGSWYKVELHKSLVQRTNVWLPGTNSSRSETSWYGGCWYQDKLIPRRAVTVGTKVPRQAGTAAVGIKIS